MYSKGAKTEAFKTEQTALPQPAPFQKPTDPISSVTPTPVLPPTPVYDPFTYTDSMTNGHSSGLSVDPSFVRSPADHENNLLDPQLLSLQPSPQHMLPTPFTNDQTRLPSMDDESPNSLPMPSPFTWNDFTFFDELNNSLGVLNPTDDMQSQIDQLMSNMIPSGSATAWPSTPNVNNIQEPQEALTPLFRIPTFAEVPIKGVHSGPPPTRSIEKKMDETAWKQMSLQLREAEKVIVVCLLI
jgi:hypothetical protein